MGILQEISSEDFEKGYIVTTPKGSLTGSFAEAQEYLGWVLDSNRTNNIQNLKEVIKTFSERFGMNGLTVEYLRNQMSPERKNKSQRIRYLLDQAGFSTISTKRYFRETRCLVSNTKRFVFGTDKEGKMTVSDEKSETISRLARCFVSEVLHKVITKDEEAKTQRRLSELNLKAGLLADTKKYQDKFANFPETTLAQQKAINRLNWKNSGYLSGNCGECKKQIRLPLCPNVETSREEQVAFMIYSGLLNDMKDKIHFCYDCQRKLERQGNWKVEQIKTFLLETLGKTKEGKTYFGFSPEEFCQEFRADGEKIGVGTITEKLNDLISEFELSSKMDACVRKGQIVLQITK